MSSCRTIVGLGEALWDVFADSRVLGGAPLNVACHVSALRPHWHSVVASRVGDDALGDQVISSLAARGIDTDYLERDSVRATSTVTVTLAENQPTYTFAEDIAWDHLQFTPAWAALAARCDAVCFGTLAQRAATSRTAIGRFLDAAPQALRLFDVNLRAGFYDAESIHAGCERATLIKLNEHELPIVAEVLELRAATATESLRVLVDRYSLLAAVLTRGERGTLLVTRDAICDPPPVSYPAAPNADAVGAGDACSAGILVGWLAGMPSDTIALLANRLGAFVASQPGATPALPAELLESGTND